MANMNPLATGVDEEAQSGYRWESAYDKTWEAIRENEEGLLQPFIDQVLTKAKRSRIAQAKNLRLGLMRHIYIVLDKSERMLDQDLRPTRITLALKVLDLYLRDFFSKNPISQLGIIITRNRRAEKVIDLTGNLKILLEALDKIKEIECTGEPSLQNSLEMCLDKLKSLPSHASKEVLIVFGSLTSCDPSDIDGTIESLAKNNVRVSIIGLAAEVKVCQKITQSTKGVYNVVLDETHFRDLVFNHLNPPPATSSSDSSLIRMGFPPYSNDGEAKPSMCVCHINRNVNFSTSGYICPQCGSKYCELPVECQICGLTLVSSTHLSRSYHHLFPVELFEEVAEFTEPKKCCSACQESMKTGARCKTCRRDFCIDCDLFIHEELHLCPGCASMPS